MGTVHGLVERPVTFDYGYNMRCAECSGITPLTATEYFSEPNGAHVDCVNCAYDIHFGQAVMTIRDSDDPVLDDQQASRVAWYHTSTAPAWPRAARPMPASAVRLLTSVLRPEDVHRARHTYETQALHLGTYESAIESMLRRMRDQDDGGEQFYLYRVALRRGLIIEPGWRDENVAEAAQITQSALRKVDAIRYLNVYESPGSLSLAVQQRSIHSVQRVSLPVRVVEVTAESPLLSEVAEIRAQIEEIESTRSAVLDPHEQRQQRVAGRQGVPFVRSPTPAQHALTDQIGQLIADESLVGVSPPVRAAFAGALEAWRSAQEDSVDDVAYISRFASMARTLTHPEEIFRALDNQAVKGF